jgi:hypothetical protein
VKSRYNSLEASGEDASPKRASRAAGVFSGSFAVSAAPPSPSLFSLFAPKCVFASPSFPCTYSLFQSEYSRKSQQSKSFIHSFAKHPGVTLPRSSRGSLFRPSLEETTIPFRITFFADHHPLTFMESYSYKKQGRGAPNSRSILPLPPNTQKLLQLDSFQLPTHSFVHGGGLGYPSASRSPRGSSGQFAHTRSPVHPELRGATPILSCPYFTILCTPRGTPLRRPPIQSSLRSFQLSTVECQPPSNDSPLTTHYPLLTIHYSLPTTHYPLLTS